MYLKESAEICEDIYLMEPTSYLPFWLAFKIFLTFKYVGKRDKNQMFHC